MWLPNKPQRSQAKQSSLPSIPVLTNVWITQAKNIVTMAQIKGASVLIRLHKVWMETAFFVPIRFKRSNYKNGCALYQFKIQTSRKMIQVCYRMSRFSWRMFVGTKPIMITKKWWNQTALLSISIASFKIVLLQSQRTWSVNISCYLRILAWIAPINIWSCK